MKLTAKAIEALAKADADAPSRIDFCDLFGANAPGGPWAIVADANGGIEVVRIDELEPCE